MYDVVEYLQAGSVIRFSVSLSEWCIRKITRLQSSPEAPHERNAQECMAAFQSINEKKMTAQIQGWGAPEALWEPRKGGRCVVWKVYRSVAYVGRQDT